MAAEGLGRREWDTSDESDIFVALTRSAIIIAIFISPAMGLLRQTPREVQTAAIVAACYTVALFLSRLANRWLPLQRVLAIAVDLYLVTAAVMAWGHETRAIFQLYYIVVIVAAMWFGRHGALLTALVALVAFVWAEMVVTGLNLTPLELLWLLWDNGAPVLLILALVSSYVLRLREIERARDLRLAHELQLARTLQRQILPQHLPRLPGWELGVRLEVARVVSGDLYGFLRQEEDTLLLWVADVAGKGVHGMMHVSLLHSHLRAAGLEGLAPAEVADRVNRGVYDALQPMSFASVFIAQLHLPSGRLTYTNCGHPHPLLLRGGRTEEIMRLGTNTPLIGVTTTPGYLQLSTRMRHDDVLVITTDGVEEARREGGEMLGDDGLIALLSRLDAPSAPELASGVMRVVREHSGGEVRDDAIVAVLRRSG